MSNKFYAQGVFTIETSNGEVIEKHNLFTDVMSTQYQQMSEAAKSGNALINQQLVPALLEICTDATPANASTLPRDMGTSLAYAPLFNIDPVHDWVKGTLLPNLCTTKITEDGFVEQTFVATFKENIGTGTINKIRILGLQQDTVSVLSTIDGNTHSISGTDIFTKAAPFNCLGNGSSHISNGIRDGNNLIVGSGIRTREIALESCSTKYSCKAILDNNSAPTAGTLHISNVCNTLIPQPTLSFNNGTSLMEVSITGVDDGTSTTISDDGVLYIGTFGSNSVTVSKTYLDEEGVQTTETIYSDSIGARLSRNSSPYVRSVNFASITLMGNKLHMTYFPISNDSITTRVLDINTLEYTDYTVPKAPFVTGNTETNLIGAGLQDAYYDESSNSIITIFMNNYLTTGAVINVHNEMFTYPKILGISKRGVSYTETRLDTIQKFYKGIFPTHWFLYTGDTKIDIIDNNATEVSYGKALTSISFVPSKMCLRGWVNNQFTDMPITPVYHPVIAETNIPDTVKTDDMTIKITYKLTSRGEFETCS